MLKLFGELDSQKTSYGLDKPGSTVGCCGSASVVWSPPCKRANLVTVDNAFCKIFDGLNVFQCIWNCTKLQLHFFVYILLSMYIMQTIVRADNYANFLIRNCN